MSNIEWTDETWNPLIGCRRVSEGCRNCYAETMAKRLVAMGAYPADVLREGGGWSGKVMLVPERLSEPLRWKRPRRVFVNSMSDLFHEDVPDEFIAAIFGVMAACPQHTFQVLTKRPERMVAWFAWLGSRLVPSTSAGSGPRLAMAWEAWRAGAELPDGLQEAGWERAARGPWPLPNVWLGVSVEDQATADARIPYLLRVPAAVRFVSYEPALGRVDFGLDMLEPPPTVGPHRTWWWHERDAMHPCDYSCNGPGEVLGPIDWIIVGGESGPGARPFDVSWARSTIAQCRAAGVACFVKQLGSRPLWRSTDEMPQDIYRAWDSEHANEPFPSGGVVIPLRSRKGGDPSEWPEDLRVREMPEVRR